MGIRDVGRDLGEKLQGIEHPEVGAVNAVVDEVEGKPYEGIGLVPVFSPDSRHVAYVAQSGKGQCVVVDGREGKGYDSIVTIGGGTALFDSPRTFRYLAVKQKEIYSVEERIE